MKYLDNNVQRKNICLKNNVLILGKMSIKNKMCSLI